MMANETSPTRRAGVSRVLFRGRLTAISAAYVLVITLSALFVAAVSPYQPGAVDPGRRLQGPSREHWLGTDDLGRDVLTRALYGARVSLLVGAIVTLLTATAGTVLGLVSAYYPRLDGPIMRVMDGLMAFPQRVAGDRDHGQHRPEHDQRRAGPRRRVRGPDGPPRARRRTRDEATALCGVGTDARRVGRTGARTSTSCPTS